MSEPMEQLDYGGIYKSFASPQQNMTLKVEGGTATLLFATLVAALLLAGVALGIALSAKELARISEREARIAQDKYFYVAAEFERATGRKISTDGH